VHGLGIGHIARWPPPLLVVFLMGTKGPVGAGAASRWLPDDRLLGPWGVPVHGEDKTVDQLVKRVRMPPSVVSPMGVIVLVGDDGVGVSRSIDSRGNIRSEGGHH
jgi:hypothetical protein